jgi:ABC-type phosphate/phosphonate transport system substrate-binding protein
MLHTVRLAFSGFLILLSHITLASAWAADAVPAPATAQKASLAPPGVAGGRTDPAAAAAGLDALVLTAPPRETPEGGREIFEPLAKYLSTVLGKPVVYKHSGNWGVYRSEMLKGSYDIVFDGAHFNGYRAEKLQHTIVAKAPGEMVFVTIVRHDNAQITQSRQLAGRGVCAHAPPNLGTLTLLAQFDNPLRQPIIVSTDGWKNIYDGVAQGKCAAGVLPHGQLNKFDPSGVTAKVIHRERAVPNNAISVGPRLSAEEVRKVATALLAPQAAAPTEKLRKAYNVGERFVRAGNQEFTGLAEFLRSEWGYY